jgi:hypothetical protein
VIDPYLFVRGVTFALGATWTVTGLVRAWRFTKDGRERLRWLAFEDRWFRRQVALLVLRATVLDPINLALLCLLLGLWSVRL